MYLLYLLYLPYPEHCKTSTIYLLYFLIPLVSAVSGVSAVSSHIQNIMILLHIFFTFSPLLYLLYLVYLLYPEHLKTSLYLLTFTFSVHLYLAYLPYLSYLKTSKHLLTFSGLISAVKTPFFSVISHINSCIYSVCHICQISTALQKVLWIPPISTPISWKFEPRPPEDGEAPPHGSHGFIHGMSHQPITAVKKFLLMVWGSWKNPTLGSIKNLAQPHMLQFLNNCKWCPIHTGEKPRACKNVIKNSYKSGNCL